MLKAESIICASLFSGVSWSLENGKVGILLTDGPHQPALGISNRDKDNWPYARTLVPNTA